MVKSLLRKYQNLTKLKVGVVSPQCIVKRSVQFSHFVPQIRHFYSEARALKTSKNF